MATFAINDNHTSRPRVLNVGQIMTISTTAGYAVLDYTFGSIADVQSGIAVWLRSNRGDTISGTTSTYKFDSNVFYKVTPFGGNATITVDETPSAATLAVYSNITNVIRVNQYVQGIIYLPEGKVISATGSTSASGTIQQYNLTLGGANFVNSWSVTAGGLAPIGPFAGTQQFLITMTAGTVDMTVEDSIMASSYAVAAPAEVQISANPRTFVYPFLAGNNDTTLINSFLAWCGTNSTIIFSTTSRYTIRGDINPLDGQELIGLRVKRCNQIIATTTSTTAINATSVAVDDVTQFKVGDAMCVGTALIYVYASNSVSSIVRPDQYSTISPKITAITPGVGNAGTLTLSRALNVIKASDGSAGSTLAIGSKVFTACHLVSNILSSGLPYNSFRMTRYDVDGNLANQTYSSWDFMSEYNMIANAQEISRPVINNSSGEGMIISGDDIRVWAPYVNVAWGNGIHLSAYSSSGGEVSTGVGVRRALIEGGYLANCNAAPTAWDVSSGLPTNRPNTAVACGRFNTVRDIGHRAGGICISDNIFGVDIHNVEVFNCWGAVGAIDSGNNLRVALSRVRAVQCGSFDDGTNTSTNVGAFNFGGNSTKHAPIDISLNGCYAKDCYITMFGSDNNTEQMSLSMEGNWFYNAPIQFRFIKINHTSGNYEEPVGSGYDTLVRFLGNMQGRFCGANMIGGSIGLKISSGSEIFNLLLDQYVCRDNWDAGMQCTGSSAMSRCVIGAGAIMNTSATNTMSSTWTGFSAAAAGGYATKQNIRGPMNIDFTYASYPNAVGLLAGPTSADINLSAQFDNVRIHMAGGKSVSMRGTFNATNCTFTNLAVYPDIVTTGWDATSIPAGGTYKVIPA